MFKGIKKWWAAWRQARAQRAETRRIRKAEQERIKAEEAIVHGKIYLAISRAHGIGEIVQHWAPFDNKGRFISGAPSICETLGFREIKSWIVRGGCAIVRVHSGTTQECPDRCSGDNFYFVDLATETVRDWLGAIGRIDWWETSLEGNLLRLTVWHDYFDQRYRYCNGNYRCWKIDLADRRSRVARDLPAEMEILKTGLAS